MASGRYGHGCPICPAALGKKDGDSLVCDNPQTPHWVVNLDAPKAEARGKADG